MDSLQAQITSEMERIVSIVEEFTGLSSRWSGVVELVPNADFKGKKPFRCDILIHADLAIVPERWSTLIHESLHTVSAGYLRDDYQDFQGWEEGVVEQIQRFLRPRILTRLRVVAAEATFDAIDEGHVYNNYIAALEQLRALVGRLPDVETFYLRLLATPIKQRPGFLLGLAGSLQGEARRQFIHTFAAANVTLRSRRPQGNLTP